ncbi:MAG: FtsX-like permease family protein [Bacteroidales bacterium]|nr:FtsX-like permease family protein [Bacteroidales bacterium]MCF8328007.1 FtsX-like permease family protein [Bacteroidales bacterium]
MIIPIAWRNVWRNRLRSLVVIIAITLGIFAGVFATSFMKGMVDQRIQSAIQTETSHLQIHHPDFQQEDKLLQYIPDANAKLDSLKKLPYVQSASSRLTINGMITAAGTGSGVTLSAIQPEKEKRITNINENIVKGTYFQDVPKRVKPIVIGQKLADKLNAKIRSRIVMQFADTAGNPISIGFRLMGIYETHNSQFDMRHVFVHSEDVRYLTGLPKDAGHEIAVLLKDNEFLEASEKQIATMFPDQKISTWKELNPELHYMNDIMGQYMYIIIVIILLALLFGIVNTMLMAVLERIKELGMLMAIGMNRRRIFLMIMMESVFLAVVGGITGILLGYGVTEFFGQTGIDLSMYATGLGAMGWSPVVYPDIETGTLIGVTLLVILTGIISAIYPAVKALQLNPADSIRTE